MALKALTGNPNILGSTFDGKGVNFALFSAHATKVELCLFDNTGSEETGRYEILENSNGIWSIYLQGAKPGQAYGYRVYGPYEPLNGHRFNPHKLLIDPYGRQLVGKLIWNKAIFGYDPDSPQQDLSFNSLDSAPYVPKTVVIDNKFDWKGETRPNTPHERSIIYEAHVRGYTKLHPKVPDAHRGTFQGFANHNVVKHLKDLGITAVEFLPIHAFFGNRHKKGYITDNYWGYESFSFFAPEQSYLATDDIKELKQTIKTLHNSGIEVFMDVVYNHTGEGNQMGPTLCYRGIDNASYYTLKPGEPRYYYDSTGVGSSFNIQNSNVLRLVMDSLRYWADEMHIDGFRFDLATTLCRQNMEFKQESGFMYAVAQDPILKSVKMIAEPWDVGWGGYQLGAFWPGWMEWSDKYRDNLRRFWKGDENQVAEFASRLLGSSDTFNYNNRNIWSSVNFITAHDGFCLHDLVSYNNKHNLANGEENRDGNDSNWSWNSGAEGETDNALILENRYTRMRAMLASLLLSFGTPMLVAGDEFARSQFGNNNPYCQDNVLTWMAWDAITKADHELCQYVKELIALRKRMSIFDRIKFFTGKPMDKSAKDIAWFNENGKEFSDQDWHNIHRKSVGSVAYTGSGFIMIVLNANFKEMSWTLPKLGSTNWSIMHDSSQKFTEKTITPNKPFTIPAWSVLLFDCKK